MTKLADLPDFDMAEWLPDETAVAEYLTVVREENDPAALAKALATIASARSMSEQAAEVESHLNASLRRAELCNQ